VCKKQKSDGRKKRTREEKELSERGERERKADHNVAVWAAVKMRENGTCKREK